MLATQTRDGDLRVWSVPKSLDSDEPARVVRVLKKPDSNRRGDNWMAWSRNGRIVQYSDGYLHPGLEILEWLANYHEPPTERQLYGM